MALKENEVAYMSNRLIGFIFQSYNLVHRMRVQKNVELPAMVSGINRAERSRKSLLLLQALGIKDKAKIKAYESKWWPATKGSYSKSAHEQSHPNTCR